MKYKVRPSPKVSVVKEASQAQALPLQSKKATVPKSPVTIGGQVDRLRYVPQELKRILIIAGILLALLIILSLLLR